MKFLKNNKGYNIIEVLIVASVMSILIVVGASNFSSKFGSRRSVDDVAHKITSTLQFIKLKAGREGVEYQANIAFDDTDVTDQFVTITTSKGDSNINSANFNQEEVIRIEVIPELIVDPANYDITYRPNGTIDAAGIGDIAIYPLAGSSIKKCGGISVNRFGRLNVVNGNWDYVNSVCDRIGDQQAAP